MILRCRFLLTLLCSWLGGIYISFIVCPHFFRASSYSNLVLLNISALEEVLDNLSLIIFVSCFLICGGWFDDTSIYVNLLFGFLYGRYVLFSKLNVTSKKSTSVRLVTISILKSIFLKILITFSEPSDNLRKYHIKDILNGFILLAFSAWVIRQQQNKYIFKLIWRCLCFAFVESFRCWMLARWFYSEYRL